MNEQEAEAPRSAIWRRLEKKKAFYAKSIARDYSDHAKTAQSVTGLSGTATD